MTAAIYQYTKSERESEWKPMKKGDGGGRTEGKGGENGRKTEDKR